MPSSTLAARRADSSPSCGEFGGGEDFARFAEDGFGHGGVALFGDELGAVVGRQLVGEEEVGDGLHVAQELHALLNEGRDLASEIGREAGRRDEGQQFARQFVRGQGTDVLGVEPEGLGVEGVFLGEVDHGVGAIDAFEGEEVDDFVARQFLAIVLGRPAEQAEEIDEGLRQEAGVAIGGDGDDGAVDALGELHAVGRHEQRQVREGGRLGAGGVEDQLVFEGVGEVLLAADDVGDAQVGVVGAVGEVIGGHAVAAQQGEILDIGVGLGLFAVDGIVELDVAFAVVGHAEAQGEGFAGGGAAVAFFARKFAHAGIAEPGSVGAGFLAIAALGEGEIAVGQAFFEDGLGHVAMQGEAVGLFVLFVPTEIEPAEAFEDGIEGRVGVAADVGIVDAEDHRAAVVAGIQPVKDVGARTPDVQKSRGRRRKTDSRHGNTSITT